LKPDDYDERINVNPDSQTLLLTEQQLILAKDFLCLALPFNDSGDWVTDSSSSSEAVHALITAPFKLSQHGPSLWSEIRGVQSTCRKWHDHHQRAGKAASSVISIVLCYLASISKRRARDVLVNLERDRSDCEGDVSVWRNCSVKEDFLVLDRIATLG